MIKRNIKKTVYYALRVTWNKNFLWKEEQPLTQSGSY